MTAPGKFLVVEGLEGAGKSTALSYLVELLNRLGVKHVLCTHEPGGTPLATKIRGLLVQTSVQETPTDLAELFLLFAARHQLIETVVRPALSQGTWILSDRHNVSSYAYQGAGRGLPIPLLDMLSDVVLDGLSPDLTFYLDVDPKIGLARAVKRGPLDRIEQEKVSFFERVRSFYQKEAKKNQKTIWIDANQPWPKVQGQLKQELLLWKMQL